MKMQTLKIMAVGDICFGQGMREFSVKHSDRVFEGVRDLVRSVDLAVANLESPLSDRGQPIPGKKSELLTGKISRTVHMRGCPASAALLANSGFRVVSLANNHIFDYGPDAVIDTLDSLDVAGVIAVGAATDGSHSCQPVTIASKELTIKLLAFSAFTGGEIQGGVSIAPLTPKVILPAVESARQEADIVIVSYHWGMEGMEYPFWKDVELARATIASGAALVLGHHPHFLQGIEKYRDGLIAYSLGNFLFDPDFASGKGRETVGLVCELGPQGVVSWEIHPITLNENGCPLIASENDGLGIRKRIQDLSAPLANPDDPVWVENRQLDLNNQASWLWARGWRQNLSRLMNVRPRHILVLWHLLQLVWKKYVGKYTS